MAAINPYLNFPGNAEEAFNFYKSVFGGDFMGGIMRFKDAPDSDKLAASDKEKVMHVALTIGDGNVLMASDALESMGYKVNFGNSVQISIQSESKEEAERIFKGLSKEGKIEMPLQDMFWGAYFGAFTDKFGIHWMVNYTYPQQK